MDANGLLSVLAIFIAGYTLLSESKRLDFQLRTSWIDWVIVGIPTLAILAIIYSPVILSLNLFKPVKWRWGFNEQIAIFSYLAFMLIFASVKMTRNSLPHSNLAKWIKISEELLINKKFSELGYLLNKYHMQLFTILSHKPWYVKIHNYISPVSQIFMMTLNEKAPLPRFYRSRTLISRLFPAEGSRESNIAQSISRILKSKPFVLHLTETYPLLAAKATLLQFRDCSEFSNYFIESLISNPHSQLYRELRDNQNQSYMGEYFLDESNELLNFYLKDANRAISVSLWKPIGDFTVGFIRENKEQTNFYNQPNNNFSDGEARWTCPIFNSTLLFEIMISSSIFQRINYHMWLMYVESFADEILESLNRSSFADTSREFPSKYDYLLYNVFSACDTWVGTAEYIDHTGLNNNLKDYPEYWAAKTLGSMLRKIITSKKTTDFQKIYFLEIAIRRMQALDNAQLQDYSTAVFENCIREYEGSRVDEKYIETLEKLYKRIDHTLKNRKSTFEMSIVKISE